MTSRLKYIKNLPVICFLTVSISACSPRLERPVTDQSGYSSVSTTLEKIAYNPLYDGVLKARAINANNFYFLYLHFELPAEKIRYFRFDNGSNVLIKLSDNSTVILFNDNRMRARRKEGLGISTRSADVDCVLSDQDLLRINSSAVTAISLQANNGDFDFDVDTKGDQMLKKLIELISTTGK
ncbi:MAG TPA: hypothetical protein VHE59_18210 [Mucilaginibacter sp.]|nr:hypothetical protein [Mucilaginibacter sp.]